MCSFGCHQVGESGLYSFSYRGPELVHPVSDRAELQAALRGYPAVLLIGVFSWSNYSREVFHRILLNLDWFREREIGLAGTCLGDPEYLREMDDDVFRDYSIANNDPILFFFRDGRLLRSRWGPVPFAELRDGIESP